jgi:transcriptional regulator with XRE-family HTH domain
MRFGEYVKNMRQQKQITLRRFCLEHSIDPGNHSKLERGILNPPQDEDKLKSLAYALGIKQGSNEWEEFFSLAFIENGKIPKEIMENGLIVSKLPLFFRTLKGEKIDETKMDKLIQLIRES